MAEPTTGVPFGGTLRSGTGTLVTSGTPLTADTYAVGTTTPAIGTQDTTFSSGQFDIPDSGFGRFDLKIVNGTEQIWWSARAQVQVTSMQVRNPTAATAGLEVFSTESAAEAVVAVFGFRPATESSGVETADTPSDGDRAHINFEISNDNATPQQFIAARLAWEAVDVSDGNEDGQFNFWTMVAGTLTEELHLDATALWPETNDGVALGKATLAFSDHFKASGHVDNWNNGDVTLTHAAGKLTFGGDGAVEIDFNNHEMTNVDIDSGAIDGTAIGAAAVAAGSFAAIVGTTINGSADMNIVGQIILNAEDEMWIGPAAASGNQTNGQMTTGLTINQEASDNQAFALKSSDIATGITTAGVIQDVETDDYFVLGKRGATTGGVSMQALATDGAGTIIFGVTSIGGTANTAKTTGGVGLIDFFASEQSSGSLANITADGNVFSVRARVGGGDLARLLIDEDGDFFVVTVDATNSNSIAAAAFDGEEDAQLVRAYERVRTPDRIIMSAYDEGNPYDEEDLLRLGILGAPVADGGMTNQSQLIRLHSGAIWQAHTERVVLEARLADLERPGFFKRLFKRFTPTHKLLPAGG